jgi:DNA helicase-2/ATP-dependent DNA helicase PcrA
VSQEELERLLFDGLTNGQKAAVKSEKRRLLVVAGAGSGKTEVMARRIAWWVGVKKVTKDNIVAFTFTERAAEEMKFRIRGWIQKITPVGEEVLA